MIYNHLTAFLVSMLLFSSPAYAQQKPNVIIIYADDLGYGDLGSYGATKINTPNLDQLAKEGIRFTNAHAAAATCTPSRYAMLTGQYPWRRNARVLAGDAPLLIDTNTFTLQKLFQIQGYSTAIIGKWHLGLGGETGKNWNAEIIPGPRETGFDYSFIFPATADRVPTIFLENQKVVGLEAGDAIQVDYTKKIGNEPTGKENPELLKMKASPHHGHENTIVNGIGRIGWMTGGQSARWTDEELGFTFFEKVKSYIRDKKNKPFFLFYSLTEPHVPRMPATMFKGKSGLGYRGDAILQIDYTVGELMAFLKANELDKNTFIIFSSDNGPVLDDGYEDGAVTQQNDHTPAGHLRGGKYSAFEGGTRVPTIAWWPGKIAPGTSNAMISQMDFLQSFAAWFGNNISLEANGENVMNALLGKSRQGREFLVKEGGARSIIWNDWKYIEPRQGPALLALTNIESGNSRTPQLYNLKDDPGEKMNVAEKYPLQVEEMRGMMEREVRER